MRNPLKQGLKLYLRRIIPISVDVAMRNPLKQGLKHGVQSKIDSVVASRNAKSTKTRIETEIAFIEQPEHCESQCEIH